MILAIMACWFSATPGWMPQNTQCGAVYDMQNVYQSSQACEMNTETIMGNLPERFRNIDKLYIVVDCLKESDVKGKNVVAVMKMKHNPVKVRG